MEDIISCKNIHKSYIKKKWFKTVKRNNVLKNLNIKIKKGEVYGLLGLNGAGKTTLIRIITGILVPDNGTVELFKMTYNESEKEIKSKLGVVMGGDRSLYWKLSAEENLEFFGTLYNVPKKKLKENIQLYLDYVGLSKYKKNLVETYSKGMKQRLLIAKSLISDPEVLILDEPTVGLDIQVAFEYRNLLKKLNEDLNLTILLTTHYLHEAEELCSRVGILKGGSIIEEGTIDYLKKRNKMEEIIEFKLKSKIEYNLKKKISNIGVIKELIVDNSFSYRVKTSSLYVEQIIDLLSSQGKLLYLEVKGITLEDIVSNYF
ncbi:daunorubicin resistance protein DrrA family ABC transporter ATP-binding protein [Tepiditoga spiralis]|uniref:Daunorubicin resistance protein DrrA family ABC transporter ATP-binding protein n=1 Tax=Tepiditoga spiralis TaxID=2108365 RepID=A0A7G1G8P8_9BACT|nr:ABC transporter ATP-binding protein [Tepiditoga spiralis]BBE31806.1 daunorubicin resistance protein DrrA family ABC transporter ATP-binding protein [Tepiditoga spiralis]